MTRAVRGPSSDCACAAPTSARKRPNTKTKNQDTFIADPPHTVAHSCFATLQPCWPARVCDKQTHSQRACEASVLVRKHCLQRPIERKDGGACGTGDQG